MKRFNTLFNKIISETVDLNSLSFDKSKFKFNRKGDDILCTFSITQNAKHYIVIANCENDILRFSVTAEDGTNSLYTEKEFAVKFNKDYDDFKLNFDKFKEIEKFSESDENKSKVKNFMDVLRSQHEKNGIKREESFEVNGTNFLFHSLEDELVQNYCECLFQMSDKDTSEIFYYKVLIALKKYNSVIIKILIFNDNGDLLDTITATDFSNKNPEMHKDLLKAIKLMAKKIYF